jgi:radical SAM protein with 4Fe4S-binding SPASM domain
MINAEMNDYLTTIRPCSSLRIPRKGSLDLTYRCNLNCHHCWVRIPPASKKIKAELQIDEIKKLVDEARRMGCRQWYISGGEPLLRADFPEIFDYITRKTNRYTLNTNGTLITPSIARLLKREGIKLVALYGADEKTHDHITRTPGSFQLLMQGIAYLKEAGTNFTMQIVPMKDNIIHLSEMVRLAESLTPSWRYGASWLYLSAENNLKKNREIIGQRLLPAQAAELDFSPPFSHLPANREESIDVEGNMSDTGVFASCIRTRQEFHVDPYGDLSFCAFAKDSSTRKSLKKNSFETIWNTFIPSLKNQFNLQPLQTGDCFSCDIADSCSSCPAYRYLEHSNYHQKIEYLCDITREKQKLKKSWEKNHRRFYEIANITIQLESELPIRKNTFHPKFKAFEVDGPGDNNTIIQHFFSDPPLQMNKMGQPVFHQPPWKIFKHRNNWVYFCIGSGGRRTSYPQVGIFSRDYRFNRLYNDDTKKKYFIKGDVTSLSLMPSDQMLIAQVLSYHEGCYFHSSGVIHQGSGFLLMGHSGAGKSTLTRILQDETEILCDDRNIVRNWPEGFKIHGTWSHGDIPEVSPSSAPLKAMLFLEKSPDNRLEQIQDKQIIIGKLLSFLIKPLGTGDWWQKSLDLLEKIVIEVPCYFLYFNKGNEVKDLINKLTAGHL